MKKCLFIVVLFYFVCVNLHAQNNVSAPLEKNYKIAKTILSGEALLDPHYVLGNRCLAAYSEESDVYILDSNLEQIQRFDKCISFREISIFDLNNNSKYWAITQTLFNKDPLYEYFTTTGHGDITLINENGDVLLEMPEQRYLGYSLLIVWDDNLYWIYHPYEESWGLPTEWYKIDLAGNTTITRVESSKEAFLNQIFSIDGIIKGEVSNGISIVNKNGNSQKIIMK